MGDTKLLLLNLTESNCDVPYILPESSFRQLVHTHNDVTTEKILLKAKHKRALMRCMQQAE